ncbi:MAG: hypothetical protein GDA36_11740, partial [Rhodobacteraceae bacterium]|nr:hypothetical protein [Paracoccaceae bacterium]
MDELIILMAVGLLALFLIFGRKKSPDKEPELPTRDVRFLSGKSETSKPSQMTS